MPRTVIDLNCDLGEGFGPWSIGETRDCDLLPLISSANIATGFHAGDPNLMNATVQQASALGVAIGAHPGFDDLVGFGRRALAAGADELVNDVLYQIGALAEFASRHGASLQHVKLHGALYMHAAIDRTFSERLVEALRRSRDAVYVFCMDGSETCAAARNAGLPVVREFYADRDYDRSGSIVFKRRVGALDPQKVADKVVRACLDGKVETVEGDTLDMDFESVCFHSDTPGSLEIVRAIRAALERNGIRVAPVAEIVPS